MRGAGDITFTLPRRSSFREGVRSPGCYWLAGSPVTAPELYYGSSARVCREVRAHFGLTSGASYDAALIQRIRDRWATLRPSAYSESEWLSERSLIDSQRTGEVIDTNVLRLMVWARYLKLHYPEGMGACHFSHEVEIPRWGDPVGTVDASVSVASTTVDANRWEFNPFTGETRVGGETPYNPWCDDPAGCASVEVRDRRRKPGGGASSSRQWLGLGLLGLVLASGGSKR
jgi:hypothetical protein